MRLLKNVFVRANVDLDGDIEVKFDNHVDALLYLLNPELPGYLILSDGTIFACERKEKPSSCVVLRWIASGKCSVVQTSENCFMLEAKEDQKRGLPMQAFFGQNVVTAIQVEFRRQMVERIEDFYII